ncbi:MAG: B12-binding domain-containing radical SAM protein [Chrysiogenetes bacterium]|nr:B12-binding domain-containing radical SAM protein [Chrysiogenetes bacterium]
MRFLFIYPDYPGAFDNPTYNFGVGYVASVLKQAGHAVDLIHMVRPMEREDLLEKIAAFVPDVIGFSAVTNMWGETKRYAAWIKEAMDTPIVVGGFHAMMAPESIFEESEHVDYACIGEGEQPTLDLLAALEAGGATEGIGGLWVRKNGQVYKNPKNPLNADLDSLPYPDRDIFDFHTIVYGHGQNAALMLSGRGCPYDCHYCCNKWYFENYGGPKEIYRKRSVDSVIAEALHIIEKYELKHIQFFDEVFISKRSWIEEFARRWKEEVDLEFSFLMRVEQAKPDYIRMLADAGCSLIHAGVESGSERVRREILNRRMSNRRIIEAFNLVKEHGIKTWAFYQIGFPGETIDDIEDSIELHRQLNPDFSNIAVFYPFPGTQLYREAEKNGWMKPGTVIAERISERTFSNFFEAELHKFHSVLNLPTLSPEDLVEMGQKFERAITTNVFRRNARGHHDFLAEIIEARIPDIQKKNVSIQSFNIDDDRRFVLFEHPDTSTGFKVELREGTWLHTAAAINPLVWEREDADAVRFEVYVKRPWRLKKKVFETVLEPARNETHRHWIPVDVDLGAIGTGEVELIFVTKAVAGHASWAWSGWAHPYLSQSAIPDAEKDLLARAQDEIGSISLSSAA